MSVSQFFRENPSTMKKKTNREIKDVLYEQVARIAAITGRTSPDVMS